MDKKKKRVLIISIITLVLLLVIGGTLAYFIWTGEESQVSITVSSGTGSCTKKSDNNIKIEPTSTKDGGRIIKITANQQMSTKAYITWNLVVNSIGGLKHESFKYELVNTTTNVSYGSGDFSNITLDEEGNVTGNNTFKFENSSEKLDYNKDYEFTLYLWIDGVNFTNPTTMANQDFDFDITCSITGTDSKETLAEHITNLYTNASKTTVDNGEGDSLVTYNIANIYDIDTDDNSSGGLINDRLGSMDVDPNGGNIRYYGANPNNYINFNCKEYPDTDCETWRIIGIVDGKIKLMKNSSIGSYSWDYKVANGTTVSYSNDWSNATLKTLLNEEYYNNSDGVTYYNNSTTPITIDFAIDGIGIRDETRDLISKSIWYINGGDSEQIYSDTIYNIERTGGKIWEGEIALPYPSDYGYAADFNSCKYNLSENTNCTSANWIESLLNNNWTWFLTPSSRGTGSSWCVIEGYVTYDCDGYSVSRLSQVFPVLYLDSTTTIESGDGSSGNPYTLSVG